MFTILYDVFNFIVCLFGSPFPLSFVVIRTGQTEKLVIVKLPLSSALTVVRSVQRMPFEQISELCV